MTRVIDRLRARCSEAPVPKHPDMFSSFPSAAAGERCAYLMISRSIAQAFLFFFRRRKPFSSPPAPARVAGYKLGTDVE